MVRRGRSDLRQQMVLLRLRLHLEQMVMRGGFHHGEE